MSLRVRNSLLIIFSTICFTIVGYAVHEFLDADENIEVQIGGPFKLTRHTGEPVSSESYLGQHLLIYFGFTNCPATCPTTLQEMTVVMRQLEDFNPHFAGKITPIFITLDPQRDTPQVIGNYIAYFHERFEGLTGTYDDLVDLVNAYGSYFNYEPADADGNYNVNHSSFVYLMGPDGKYLTHFTPDETVEQMLDWLKKRLT